jgi:hypothetical protein
MPFRGSCHCGRLAYTLDEELPTKGIECNCSMCQRKGTIHHFSTPDKFTFHGSRDDIVVYTFNTHNVQHQSCRACGCSPFASGTSPAGVPMIEINLRCVEGIDLGKIERIHFDGASV